MESIVVIVFVFLCFSFVLSQEQNTTDEIISVSGLSDNANGSSPTNGALNSVCQSNYDCKINGSRCEPMSHTCKCLFLLIPLHDRCVNPTPIPHETIWIINHYVDLIIGLSVVIVALASLLAPIKGKLLGERLYCGVRDKLRESRRSRVSESESEARTAKRTSSKPKPSYDAIAPDNNNIPLVST